ncbi:ATP-binding protein [Streptomyces sp. NPDC057099]|uniref:ATP-binding protein n=1 Tax=Streptomyces sp. NPDC057099 TaxID=3346019 RepID=UPI00362C93B3
MPHPHTPALLTHDWSMGYPMTLRSVRLARLHNAVLHGRVVGHELWLRQAVLEDGRLSIEVSDPVRAFPEVREWAGGETGRGLLVVSRIAEELDWFLREEVGKTVRARLAAGT